MRKTRSHRLPKILLIFVVFAAVVAAVILFLSSINRKTGTLILTDSLTADEKSFIQSLFPEDQKFSSDVTVSATTESAPSTTSNTFTYDILVPVADFYDTRSSISSTEANNLLNSAATDTSLISITKLTSNQKLLAIDDNYYLDTFNSGAFFRTFQLTGDDASEILTTLNEHKKTFPEKSTTLSIAQTGVTALSRAMQTKLKSVGDSTYFAAKIKDFLSSKDLTHISNEVSFVSGCDIDSGAVVLCADPLMINAITAIGTDIVELTGNHNVDYGDDPAIDTYNQYQQLGLKTFGGGIDSATAAQPLNIDQKSTKITFLGYNYSSGGYTTDDTPGANFYTEEKAKSDIATAKQNGDFVIVDVQYYECYCYPDEGEEMPACDEPISGQTEFFRDLIDMGADMVVGTQAHQPQTYEEYNGGVIYYGLGNLFFDQTYWPGTTRGLILTHYFVNGNYIQTRISPTVYDTNYQTELMDEASAAALLTRLTAARP